jgi:hypothetical protein
MRGLFLFENVTGIYFKKKANMPLTAEDYDKHWNVLSDYVKYNPGAKHRRRLILKLIKHLPIKNCLDIGCGKGELLILLNK